jgi:hypothetical protein
MASQYITFMIIFIMGLGLVIITNSMFLSISDQFRQNIASVEMDQILTLIQEQIQRNILLSADDQQIIEQQLELPDLLGQGLRYSIELSNSSQNILIHGYTLNKNIDKIRSFSVEQYNINANGKFESLNPLLNLRFEKNGSNIIITIS